MEIEVTLQVSGIELGDERTTETLGRYFPELLWQGDNQDLTVTFTVSVVDAAAEVLEKVRALTATFPAFKVSRVDRDLVSTTEISTRVGVSREAARKWGMEPDFPTPYAHIGNTKAWLWCEVLAWLQVSRGIDMDEQVPSEALMVQIDNCLSACGG